MRISPAYLAEQKRLHADPRGYGGRGDKWAPAVAEIAVRMGKIDAILDYGCGQNTLAAALAAMGYRTRSYDPAIPAFDSEPLRSDLVVCTDVLEHVETEMVVEVLEHIAALCRQRLFVVISLVPTSKTLSDGRQAHITLKPPAWWECGLELVGFRLAKKMKPMKPEKEFVAIYDRIRT